MTVRRRLRIAALGGGAMAATLTLTACVGGAGPVTSTSPSATADARSPLVAESSPTATVSAETALWRTAGAPAALAGSLRVPWSIVPFADGTRIVSLRGGAVLEVDASGSTRTIGTVPDVNVGGEGGLLGLAVLETDAEPWLYAYLTSWSDNRVIRMPLVGEPGERSLGPAEVVLEGIPRAGNHNGGRIAFGPDGYLYIATGDAGNTGASQDPASLAGKILRVGVDGIPAQSNPFGNAVYSLGHRNVQGLAWTADGTMWATEFGQNATDEINRIVAGGNYGWPVHEGPAGDPAYIDPVVTWTTDEASPSGLAAAGSTLFVAALRGERVWQVDVDARGALSDPQPLWVGEFGRIRDAVIDGDELLLLTNNTDGRGSPSGDDDRLLSVQIVEAAP
ncbi:PQQ-dependent sugar dehydrogenase [Microbacterium schleiferi]|uniref:PQQ-dependent sugar dehydrogenase n=1 Tax=Microbacterium schleiferi TaxID=69362 RepID=UPI0035C7C75A